MYDWEDDSEWLQSLYESSNANEIYSEAFNKLKSCLNDDLRIWIEGIQERNEFLENENRELKRKLSNIEYREKMLETKEATLEKTVLKRKFSEMLKPFEEQFFIWAIDYEHIYKEKCDKCDNDRKIWFKSPSGKDLFEYCSCSETVRCYYPKQIRINSIKLFKDNSYPYMLSVRPQYSSLSYEDMYCTFNLEKYIDDLEKLEQVLNSDRIDYEKIGFANLEDCKKVVDKLNKNIPDEFKPYTIKERFDEDYIHQNEVKE